MEKQIDQVDKKKKQNNQRPNNKIKQNLFSSTCKTFTKIDNVLDNKLIINTFRNWLEK